MSFQATWAVALTEIGLNVRLIRTWFFVLFIAGLSVVSYSLEQFQFYRDFSVLSSSSYETSSPLLLPIGVFSEFQFIVSFGIIFLAFDLLSRDKQARLDEVIAALPLKNIQLVFGRALGISAFFYLVIASFICCYYLLGVICELALPSTGFRRPELTSTIATLLFDVFPYLLFWTSAVMLVTVLVRYRVIVAAISIGLMLGVFWLQNNVPLFVHTYWGLSVLSSQLPSELAPLFPPSILIVQRVLLVLFACALLYGIAKNYPRLDKGTGANYLAPASILGAFWFGGITFVNAQILTPRNDHTAPFEHVSSPVVDVVAMKGTIGVEPGSAFALDINLEIIVTGSTDVLVLSLNPGYVVDQITLNDEPATYEFEHGRLRVQSPSLLTEESSNLLYVRARGNINTSFPYVENAFDSLRTRDQSERELVAYGSHASINHKDYVALMPVAAWYPVPGNHVFRDSGRDFFKMDLEVSVPENWYVGGPGKSQVEAHDERAIFRFTPKNPIHQVALFASEFDRRSTEIEDIEFELLVSKTSTKNIDLFTPIVEDLTRELTEFLGKAKELGLEYPFDGFSVVEVPNYLRTFRQRVHMPSTRTQPGMFLLREGKFLAAPFQAAIQGLIENTNSTETEKREKLLAYLLRYFRNDVSGGNVFAAAASSLFAFQTHPAARGAETMSFILDFLVLKLLDIEGAFHSAYILDDEEWSDLMDTSARSIAAQSGSNTTGTLLFSAFANRPDVWEALLNENQDTESESIWNEATHHHSQILLAAQVGDLALDIYGVDRIAQLLATLRDRFRGRTFSYDDLIEIAHQLEIPLDEVMDLWFDGPKPAGFRTSASKTVRLPDEADGTPVYESNLFIENTQPNEGFFKLGFAMEIQETTGAIEFDWTDPIKLAGNSAIEVALHMPKPISALWFRPYLSLNRETFKIPVERQRHIRNESRSPKPFITTTSWTIDEGDAIVIDDLDAGFSVDPSEDDPLFKFNVFSMTPSSSTSNGMDAGLKSAGGFAYLSQNHWMRQQADTAFGRYRKTFVRAESWDSTPLAHFRAHIPEAGQWKLEYHLPDISTPNAQEGRGWRRYNLLVDESSTWADFDLRLRVGDLERPIKFDGDAMQAGWNDLGTYELPNQTVTLGISSDTDYGTTVIDAIRWTPVETQSDSI